MKNLTLTLLLATALLPLALLQSCSKTERLSDTQGNGLEYPTYEEMMADTKLRNDTALLKARRQ